MSEQARHTPGPWRPDFDDEMGEMRLRSYRDSRGRIIAIVRNDELDDELSGDRYCTVEQARANARLIAAAPELLEALQTLLRRIERDNLHTTHGVKLDSARAAIAKATGGAP